MESALNAAINYFEIRLVLNKNDETKHKIIKELDDFKSLLKNIEEKRVTIINLNDENRETNC